MLTGSPLGNGSSNFLDLPIPNSNPSGTLGKPKSYTLPFSHMILHPAIKAHGSKGEWGRCTITTSIGPAHHCVFGKCFSSHSDFSYCNYCSPLQMRRLRLTRVEAWNHSCGEPRSPGSKSWAPLLAWEGHLVCSSLTFLITQSSRKSHSTDLRNLFPPPSLCWRR